MKNRQLFQTTIIQPTQKFYRIHKENRYPLYFGPTATSKNTNRYDCPSENRHYQVCYLAFDALGSYIEVFGRSGVDRISLDKYRLSTIRVKHDIEVVNLPDAKHLGLLRINSSSYCDSDYSHSQKVALLVYVNEFDGIVYILRHSMELQLRGLAVFGDNEKPDDMLTVVDTEPIPAEVIDQAERVFRTDLISEGRFSDFDTMADSQLLTYL